MLYYAILYLTTNAPFYTMKTVFYYAMLYYTCYNYHYTVIYDFLTCNVNLRYVINTMLILHTVFFDVMVYNILCNTMLYTTQCNTTL